MNKEIMALVSRHIPDGKANALPNKYFREMLNKMDVHVSDAEMRDVMLRIRRDENQHKLLCGDTKGYYWAKDAVEATEYIASLEGRIAEMQKTLDCVKTTYAFHYTSPNKDAITEELLLELGFVKIGEGAFKVYELADYILKMSVNKMGVWGWIDTKTGIACRPLVYRASQLIEKLQQLRTQ